MWIPPSHTWEAGRREVYLLRSIDRPLSVDSIVWGSVFGEGLPQAEEAKLNLDAARLPRWRGPSSAQGPYVEPTVPRDLDPTWTWLGYDVADRGQLSGLSNCGYREEAREARIRWGPLLNA